MFCSVWRGRPSLARINNLNKPQLCWVFSPGHPGTAPQNCNSLMSLLNRAAEPLCQSPLSPGGAATLGNVLMVLIYRLVDVQGGEQEAAMNCDTLATVTRENDAAQQPTHWWWEMFLLSFGERTPPGSVTDRGQRSRQHLNFTDSICLQKLLVWIICFQ